VGTIHGINGWLGAGKQSGAALLRDALVARDRFSRFYTAEFVEDARIDQEPTSARPEVEEIGIDAFDVRLNATLDGSTEGILSRAWYSLLGAKASAQQAATAAYKHTLSRANTVPNDARLSFELKQGTLAQSDAANGIVNEIRVDFTQQGHLRHHISALCGPTEEVSPTSETLPLVNTLLTRRGAGLTDGLMTIAGEAAARVRSGTITVRRALEEDDFDVLSQFRADAEYGALLASFSVTLGFRDKTLSKKFWGGTGLTKRGDTPAYYNSAFAFARPDVIASTFRHMEKVNMPRTHLTKVSKPFTAGGAVAQTVEGIAVYDAATTKAIDVELVNSQTTV
jgi:hypothetical protein